MTPKLELWYPFGRESGRILSAPEALEALKGDRKGQHSIRVDDQWRVCFKFVDGDAYEVEIVDYHYRGFYDY